MHTLATGQPVCYTTVNEPVVFSIIFSQLDQIVNCGEYSALLKSVFLPGKSHGQRSLVGYSSWGCKESDTTELLHLETIYESK